MPRPKKKRAPAAKREVRPGRVKRQREERESEDEAPAKRQKVTWRGWRDVFPIGTEWENMKGLDEVEWDFGHLREDMLHGELSALNDPVYFFCSTEPQMVPFEGRELVLTIPHIVAIVGSVAPPAELGIKSVTMVEEQIIPMSRLRIGWAPWMLEGTHQYKGGVPKFFRSVCTARKSAIDGMSEVDRKRYDYSLPYIFIPRLRMDEEIDSQVHKIETIEGRPVDIQFDVSMDSPSDIVEELVEDYEFLEGKEEQLKKIVTEIAKGKKAEVRAKKKARQDKFDKLSPKEVQGLNNLRLLKYYPQNTSPDLSAVCVPYINRYYGPATVVKPERDMSEQVVFDIEIEHHAH